MKCPNCGNENLKDARFCSQCGAKIEGRCPACGTVNPAASNFCHHCAQPLATDRPLTSQTDAFRAGPREERRWATVVFADLSGFTRMSERMDPEDVKGLAQQCADRMSEQVRRFGGTVVNVAGDQVVAVFGAPVTHEDDAERAVRAGLAIRDGKLSDDPSLPVQVHVGINTGEVMAGVIGPQERRDYTVIGDTVNTAARLMSAAPPGSVLVGEETYRATRGVVRYRDLPPVTVKGKERPLSVWEALDAAAVARARPLGTAPLVGRDEELALLSGTWLKVVRESRPHLVSVLGEPGIGKSRLVGEFERRILAASDATMIRGRCLPYGEALGYWALAQALKEAANIFAEDDPRAARTKLTELVLTVVGAKESQSEAHEVARHLALLSGLEVNEDRPTQAADQRTLHASVRRFFEALALRRPLCVMFEDIHWADDALLDLIEFIASRAKEVPLLILTQARPALLEKRANWGGGVRAFTSLSLEPLSEAAGRDLIVALCRERKLPETVAEQVGRGAGGNPLFAEELVAMIAERGTGGGIPSAIKALISARLDNLPLEERSTLQFAAVFGKVFWEDGLRALCAGGDVAPPLEALEQKDLIRVHPRSQLRGGRECIFKHDLIRDVAYETLPRAERRKLHGQIADWIERVAGAQIETYFDQLAHHALSAGQDERAMNFLVQAAERAHRLSAHREEVSLLAQALALGERIRQPAELAVFRARRGTAFGRLAMWVEARRELELALGELPVTNSEQRLQLLVELSAACFYALDLAGTRTYAQEAVSLAESLGQPELAADAMGWLASAVQADGKPREALEIHHRAHQQAGGRPMSSRGSAALTLYFLGEIDEAIEVSREAVDVARDWHHTSAVMHGLPHLGVALATSGEYAQALRVFAEARQFGNDYEVWPLLARSIAFSAGFHLDVHDFAGNQVLAEEARELARSNNFLPTVVSAGIDLLFNFTRRQEVAQAEKLLLEVTTAAEAVAGWHGWLWQLRLAQAQAEIAFAAEKWHDALRWSEDSITQSHAKGRVKYEVLGLWTRANALAALGRTHEAIADLRRALELARPVGDPAMFFRPAAALLALEGSDALLAEARTAAQRILAALPEGEMRQRFEAAEPVRRVLKI